MANTFLVGYLTLEIVGLGNIGNYRNRVSTISVNARGFIPMTRDKSTSPMELYPAIGSGA